MNFCFVSILNSMLDSHVLFFFWDFVHNWLVSVIMTVILECGDKLPITDVMKKNCRHPVDD